MDEHIIEAVGHCRVVVRNGRVTEVGTPLLRDCQLARRFAYPVTDMTPEAIGKNVQGRIDSFGMCTSHRELYSDDTFVGFGASELISSALADGLIDAAVIACDGAGTVVVTDPGMVQGIGGRMSGLVRTTPFPAVIDRIRAGGGIVPDPETASLDPVMGIYTAKKAGYKRPVVTIHRPEDAMRVRKTDPDTIIIAVHTTGYSRIDAEIMAESADLVTACASLHVRQICGPKALMQAGSTVPVFALTPGGKEFILNRMAVISYPLYVSHATLPVAGEKEPSPLI
ncbi:MAG: DUF2099 family protein [Methanospirillum sp.]|nr:DUF2099 family protein [Methanospirillum sp.]